MLNSASLVYSCFGVIILVLVVIFQFLKAVMDEEFGKAKQLCQKSKALLTRPRVCVCVVFFFFFFCVELVYFSSSLASSSIQEIVHLH